MKIPIHLDSSHKTSGSIEKFETKLTQHISKVTKLTLIGVEIPFTFYIFNSTNNKLDIKVGAVTETMTLPDGNYTAQELASTLETLLNAGSFSGFTVAFSSITLKYKITNASNFDIIFVANNFGSYLGYVTTATKTGANTYTSDNAANLSNDNYLLIKSYTLTTGLINRPINNNKESTVLFKVPIFANRGGVVFYVPPYEMTYCYRDDKSLESIDLQIVDKYENQIDMNGINWSMSLLIDFE